MTDFRFGPVDLFLVGFEGERPDPGVVDSILELVGTGQVRVLDALVISRSEDGAISAREVKDVTGTGFESLDIAAVGIAGQEDVDEFGQLIEAGHSAALIALELSFARTLTERFTKSGAEVLSYQRVPAPVVNAVADLAEAVAASKA